ncbi:hypothetical protein [Burkholderia thailandensis]|uniref:hypothetical protein n=1 Tax=Burkholderia thailandensis TaxID=57975 RepID=UPI002358A4FF|nr:hypothetical protein [Burkholderia thailandensis]
MVEIARSLAGDCRVLILDEPTAMLTAREVELLFDQIARLKADGVALVYISHRLEELARVAQRWRCCATAGSCTSTGSTRSRSIGSSR